MNAIKIETTAPERKEIDLSFIQMIQRDRNAKEYIANVAYRNSLKAAHKRNRWNRLKVSITNILCGVSFVAGGFGLILLGAVM